MANIIALATGNFTAAGSWGVVDAAGEIDSQLGTVVISTSNIDSPVFTPGAITVDGVALKLSARAAAPVGTFSITLRNSTGAVDVETVTVNVSDLHAAGLGWIFIKFASSHLLLAVTDYIIRLVCSNTGTQVTLYRSTAGTNNFSKKMRTTTTQAPGAGDHIIVCGELTGAGTGADITITMDGTAATSYGPTVSGGPPQGIVVSSRGILTWGVAAATAYVFTWKGVFQIAGGGQVNVGTVGSPMPVGSSALLDCNLVANGDTGIECMNGGTFKAYGTPPGTVWTRLTADAAALATVLAVQSTTGWAAGDELGLSATSAAVTPTAFEKKAILTVDSPTQVTLAAGLTFAHLGTDAERLCEVGNLTRNVKIKGNSTTVSCYIVTTGATAVSVLHGVEVWNCGLNTTGKRGMAEAITAGVSVTVSSSVHRDSGTTSRGLESAGAGITGLSITNNVYYSIGIFLNAAGVGFGIISGNLGIGYQAGSTIVCNGTETFKDNALTSQAAGTTVILTIGPAAAGTACDFTRANFSGNVFHHANNASAPVVSLSAALSYAGTLLNWKLWSGGAGQAGATFAAAVIPLFGLVFEGWNVFGVGYCISFTFSTSVLRGWITLLDCVFSGANVGTNTSAVNTGLRFGGSSLQVLVENCTFSVVTGVHTTLSPDIDFTSALGDLFLTLLSCNLASATPIAGLATLATSRSYVVAEKWAQTVGDHRGFFTMGKTTLDTVIFQTASPSLRLVPSSASVKLFPAIQHVQCDSGAAPTVSVAVRKSVVGDASYQSITPANYNGAEPRLIVKRAIALGLAVDTVIDTMSVAVGNWETLTGALPVPTDDGVYEVYVDCDGTAGWVNVDDWVVS